MKKLVPTDATLIPTQAKRVFNGVIFDVYQWQQLMFDGSPATFEMVKRTDTVEIICVDNNRILIFEEEQPHSGTRVGFPGGRVDPEDETLLAAAQRELKEEAGLEFKDWRLIKVAQPFTKGEWFIHTYLATNQISDIEAAPDNGEKLQPKWVEFDELKKLVLDDTRDVSEYHDLFQNLNSLDELLNVSNFKGQEVDR